MWSPVWGVCLLAGEGTCADAVCVSLSIFFGFCSGTLSFTLTVPLLLFTCIPLVDDGLKLDTEDNP